MGTTHFSGLAVDGYAFPKVISESVAYTQFTNGTTVATYALAGTIPAGAVFHWSAITAVTGGFAGTPLVSATMTIGDGTDVDRYSGTAGANVYTEATAGVDPGTPSGVRFHAAAKQPVLTITPGTAVAATWGSVTSGTVSVRLYYFD